MGERTSHPDGLFLLRGRRSRGEVRRAPEGDHWGGGAAQELRPERRGPERAGQKERGRAEAEAGRRGRREETQERGHAGGDGHPLRQMGELWGRKKRSGEVKWAEIVTLSQRGWKKMDRVKISDVCMSAFCVHVLF